MDLRLNSIGASFFKKTCCSHLLQLPLRLSEFASSAALGHRSALIGVIVLFPRSQKLVADEFLTDRARQAQEGPRCPFDLCWRSPSPPSPIPPFRPMVPHQFVRFELNSILFWFLSSMLSSFERVCVNCESFPSLPRPRFRLSRFFRLPFLLYIIFFSILGILVCLTSLFGPVSTTSLAHRSLLERDFLSSWPPVPHLPCTTPYLIVLF